jgi:hypothetical protein
MLPRAAFCADAGRAADMTRSVAAAKASDLLQRAGTVMTYWLLKDDTDAKYGV